MLGYLWLHKYEIRFWHLALEFCAPLGLCCGPDHSFILVKSTQCIFFTSNSEQFWSFLYVFILVLNFLKALGFCQNFIYNIYYIFIDFFPISPWLWNPWINIFKPESEFSTSDFLLVPKMLFRLPASSLSSPVWRLTLSSYSCPDSLSDHFWHSLFSSVLSLK